MVKVKMMNENVFAKLTKEFSSQGELIRTRQEEKQSVLNEYDKELARYKRGNISENTLASSVKKTNAELTKLDKSIRTTIAKCISYSSRMNELIRNQKPIIYKARESGSGLASAGAKKKKPAKRKPAKKKAVKRKAPARKKAVKKKGKITKAQIAAEMKAEKKLIRKR
jgi:hypothetical protein